jgi:hypothetical protein
MDGENGGDGLERRMSQHAQIDGEQPRMPIVAVDNLGLPLAVMGDKGGNGTTENDVGTRVYAIKACRFGCAVEPCAPHQIDHKRRGQLELIDTDMLLPAVVNGHWEFHERLDLPAGVVENHRVSGQDDACVVSPFPQRFGQGTRHICQSTHLG